MLTFIICTAAATLGAAIGFGQLLESSRSRARNVYISMFWLLSAYWLFVTGFVLSKQIIDYPGLMGSHAPGTYAIGPSIFLYFRKSANKRKSSFKKEWLHFLPATIVAIYLVPFYGLETNMKTIIEKSIHSMLTPLPPEFQGMRRAYAEAVRWVLVLPKISLLTYIGLLLRYRFFLWRERKGFAQSILPVYGVFVVFETAIGIAFIHHFVRGHGLLWLGVAIAAPTAACIFLLDRRSELLRFLTAKRPVFRPVAEPDLDEAPDLKSKITSLMETERPHLNEDLTVTDFARKLQLSPRQAARWIHVLYGKNFNQFINEHRIQEACKLLVGDESRSVISIAYEVGFNTKSVFNRAFREVTGLSPREYRKEKA